jgi:hypothetical protein
LGRGLPQFSLSSRLLVSPGPIRKEAKRKSTTEGAIIMGGARKYELAQQSEDGGQHEKEGNPVGNAAHNVPLVIDRKREFGSLMVEEPIGDLQVPQGIGGEQGP